MTTWCELKEVESIDRAGLNTGNVAETTGQLLSIDGWVVDDERSTALTVTTSTELALTSADLARCLDLLDIRRSTNSLQESNSRCRSCEGGASKDLRVNDKGNLGNVRDLVSTSQQESWDG